MKSGPIEEKYAALIVREVLIALAFLHRQDIIHRDVKGKSPPSLPSSSPSLSHPYLTHSLLLTSCQYPPNSNWQNPLMRFRSSSSLASEFKTFNFHGYSIMDGSRSYNRWETI